MKWNYGMKWNQCRNFKQQVSASCNHMVFSLPLLFNFRHVSQAKLGTVASFCLKQWWQWRLKSSIVLKWSSLPRSSKDSPKQRSSKNQPFFQNCLLLFDQIFQECKYQGRMTWHKKNDFLGQWRKGRFLFNSNSSWWMKHEEMLFGRPLFFSFWEVNRFYWRVVKLQGCNIRMLWISYLDAI